MFNKLYSHAKNSQIHSDTVIPVEEGLAYTPAQMNELRQRGLPISTAMAAENFYDGDVSASVAVDPLETRGFEAIDAWNLEKTARSRLIGAHKKDVSIYGE